MGVSPMSLKKKRCSRHLRPMERRAGRRSSSFANLRDRSHVRGGRALPSHPPSWRPAAPWGRDQAHGPIPLRLPRQETPRVEIQDEGPVARQWPGWGRLNRVSWGSYDT